MKFRNIFLVLVFAATMIPANSRITSDLPSVQMEASTFKVHGKNLTSKNNPAKAWVENLDGTNKTVLPTLLNKRKNAIKITLPLVDEDTKMNLFISGGDVAENDPAQYFIAVLNNPNINVATASDLPTITGSEGSGLGGVPGPQGPQGPQGFRGLPGFVYDGNKDIDALPDYMDSYESQERVLRRAPRSQTAGELELGDINAVTIIDSNTETQDILGLIKGSGAVGQKLTLIVDNFFYLALSNAPFISKETPVEGSIVNPNFYYANKSSRKGRTIDVDYEELLPVYPGMILELIFDGTQWRITNTPFYYDSCYGDCT